MSEIRGVESLELDSLVNTFSFCKPEDYLVLREKETVSFVCLYCGKEQKEKTVHNDFLLVESSMNLKLGICSHCYTAFYSV